MRKAIFCSLGFLAVLATPAQSDEVVVPIRPEQTMVTWTLGAPLHAVHGNFGVKDGSLRFDPQSNTVGGDVTIDLMSGGSGNAKRDGNMRNDVLETAKFPVAIFSARSITGHLNPSGASHLMLGGTLLIHGSRHDLELPLDLESRDGRVESGETRVTIPYVAWGMQQPSLFGIRVSDHVDVDVRVTAQPAGAANP